LINNFNFCRIPDKNNKLKRYFIRLSYDGTNFCGWQNQNNQESVQGTIESALTTLLREKQAILGCGRTDTGVHADDYYAHWDFEDVLPDHLILKLNSILPRSISIKDIFEVDPNYNARYNATVRTYHYFIHTQKNPFRRLYSYEYPHQKLNFDLMTEAAALLLNYNEFLPLIKLDKITKKTNCTLYSSKLENIDENYIRYEISANRFLHNMVRRIVGTIILIGRGNMALDELKYSLDNQLELRLIALAPANGLHLVKIDYPFLINK
jgi:tRNA pseudouridine38-40 synthase